MYFEILSNNSRTKSYLYRRMYRFFFLLSNTIRFNIYCSMDHWKHLLNFWTRLYRIKWFFNIYSHKHFVQLELEFRRKTFIPILESANKKISVGRYEEFYEGVREIFHFISSVENWEWIIKKENNIRCPCGMIHKLNKQPWSEKFFLMSFFSSEFSSGPLDDSFMKMHSSHANRLGPHWNWWRPVA